LIVYRSHIVFLFGFWFLGVCSYADDLDFPQPDPKAGEISRVVVLVSAGWRFLLGWSVKNNVTFRRLVVFLADLTVSHPASKTICFDNFTVIEK
jgi:hypothetical protein